MSKSKSNVGGARPGAGRPRLGKEKRQTVSVAFSAEALAKLDQLAESNGLSRSAAISELIERTKLTRLG